MSLIGRFEHLPNRPKSDEARPLLEKIASQVKPIMAKRSWTVGTLAEFLPSNPALLGNNMNHGQRINLRLRPPGDITNFYEYDQLVLVMLHELTHIEHGPHDAKFYKLLAELEEEYYTLKRKGYSGEGFHGQGNHLAGIKVNEYEGRAKGLAAAQKRMETQMKIGKGGVLGGSDHRGRSMKDVLAEAAERRIRDDKSCQTHDDGHAREVEEEVRKAQQESVGVDAKDLEGTLEEIDDGDTKVKEGRETDKVEVIIISDDEKSTTPSPPNRPQSVLATTFKATQPKPPRPIPPNGTAKKLWPTTDSQPGVTSDRSPPNSGNNRAPSISAPPKEWSCPTCTLINPLSALSCEACTTSRPVSAISGSGDGWYCEFCGAGPREMGYWSCAECGWVRKWG